MQLDSNLFTTLLVWSMVLTALVFARIFWRHLRAGSYVCIGLFAILLDYLSNERSAV
ncbi:UNVERIFIED_ORG: lipopolysaccharide export LptBFGC system permease protein LptF [Burkholderia sp. 1263]